MQYMDIFKVLNDHGVRYLVVGGVAVNLHGVQRATADLDIIVALDHENIVKFAGAMDALGYKPKVPVKMADFADPDKRKSWREEKNMVVFSLYHPKDPFALIDVFVEEPMPFKDMEARGEIKQAFDTPIPIVSIEDMIILKEKAGRPKDRYDIATLGEVLKISKEMKGD